jgi:hypothetical protein
MVFASSHIALLMVLKASKELIAEIIFQLVERYVHFESIGRLAVLL